MDFLSYIREHPLVLDGAMGTMIQDLGLSDQDFGGTDFKMLSDLLVLSKPDAQRDIHLAYYRAGAHAVETNTFGASPMRMSEYNFAEMDTSTFAPNPYGEDPRTLTGDQMAYSISRRACELACEARDLHRQDGEYDGRPLFVVGSIGPSNRVISSTDADLTQATFDEIAQNFYHQVRGLVDGGADVLLYETQQDILEVKAAIYGGQQAMRDMGKRVPIMCQVTVDAFGKMQIFNTDITAALTTVQGLGIDTFGINCSIGPDLMEKTVDKIAAMSRLPISIVPNAGLPVSEAGKTVYKFEPERMAGYLRDFVAERGVNIVGGCCGTGPGHIAAIADAVRGVTPAKREPVRMTYVSGPQEAVALDSDSGLILIGERLNVRGSKKVRQAVENDEGIIDHDALEEVVEEQVSGLGLRVIDVCMDSNVVDTATTLRDVVHRQTTNFTGAMSLDSFAVDSLAETIKWYPGRPIVNSFSMEDVSEGKTKVEAVIEAVEWHNPVYIGLAAGAKGPGATREEKANLASQIVETAGRFGVTPDRIFIDMNVFPIGSESDESMNFAMESIESIPLIKAIHPDLRTTCGVGNLTNGLAKKPYMRKVLTSVWLDEARKRGLDAAIINPNHYVVVTDLDEKDYELGLRVVLERDMDAFADLEDIAEEKKGHTVTRRTSYDDLSLEDAICEKIKDGFKQREAGSFEYYGTTYEYSDKIVLETVEAIKTHEPLDFINQYLMKAMNELGDGFARGEVSLPHLLKSADVMKQVMGFLEAYMKNATGADVHSGIDYKGTIVLGTVYQDVHSIGKDLAKTLFENYGYRVIDLGVMTPLQQYIDSAKEHNADAIGMSALLVQTSNHMITVSKMAVEQGLADLPILIGGAPVNDRHAAFVAMGGDDDPGAMRSNVFYCPTAMDGVNVMNAWTGSEDKAPILEVNHDKLRKNFEKASKRASEQEKLLEELPLREVSFNGATTLPENPWFRIEEMRYRVGEFAPYMDLKTLFALNWKFGGKSAREKRGETQDKLEALFQEWVRKSEKNGWLQPMGLCGVYPCQSEGDEVIVYDPDDLSKELCRFKFATVIGAGKKDKVCAAQYFRPRGDAQYDAVGIQITTSGPQVDDQIAAFRESGDSESQLYLQGMSDRIAEDMADAVHAMLRDRLGFENGQGIRWSPGYPAIPDSSYNETILNLLEGDKRIGVRITEAGEFSPTGTTAAIVCFHPEARFT